MSPPPSTRSDHLTLPPTPPPLPDFIRRKIESRETSKAPQYPRKVKLILPSEPPGESSTDDHFDVVVARKENTRKVIESSDDNVISQLMIQEINFSSESSRQTK